MDTITPQKNKLEKVSFVLLLITLIIAPFTFIPTTYAPLDFIKTIVITFGVLVSSIIYFISVFKEKELNIPKHPLFVFSCGIIISLIISTFLSPNILKSFFGQGFEIGTASFLITLFLSSLLTVYLTYKNKDRVLYIYTAIILSFIVIILFHISRFIFGADTFVFGIFQSAISTMLGKWNDVAIFSGVIAIISYLLLRFITLKKSLKIALFVLLIVSGVFIVIVNSFIVWFTALIVAVALFIGEYYISSVSNKGSSGILKKVPIYAGIILLFTIFGVWKGDYISSNIIKKLNVAQTEVTLPWQLTLDVASDTIKESPFFGAGPNRFMNQYLKFKPFTVINPTAYWNAEFTNGSSLIATSVVTQGIVGSVLWLLLIIILSVVGFKAFIKNTDDSSRFFISSTYFSSLFLWIINFFCVPSHVILFITFIVSGLFISALINTGKTSMVRIGSNENSLIKKFIPIILIVIIAILVLWLAVYTKRAIALGYFQGGISTLNASGNQNLLGAEANFKKALSLDKSDTYYQALSEINILKITAIAQKIQEQTKQAGATPDPELIKNIGTLIDEAKAYTDLAIKTDPTNYYNYIAKARISELALSLKVPNAFEDLTDSYKKALVYNPYNPALYLNFARIEATQNKLAEAQRDIGAALQLKQNYVEAIFLLSQIQASQGQIKDAITSVKFATQVNPGNPLLFFQLGLLYYNDKNYKDTIDSLNKALELDKNYANAQYFLGLSYARMNNFPDAITQFENLAKTNGDNQEVMFILSNLKSGRTPFTDAKPPIDNKPEQRKTLPVKEKTQTPKIKPSVN